MKGCYVVTPTSKSNRNQNMFFRIDLGLRALKGPLRAQNYRTYGDLVLKPKWAKTG